MYIKVVYAKNSSYNKFHIRSVKSIKTAPENPGPLASIFYFYFQIPGLNR